MHDETNRNSEVQNTSNQRVEISKEIAIESPTELEIKAALEFVNELLDEFDYGLMIVQSITNPKEIAIIRRPKC